MSRAGVRLGALIRLLWIAGPENSILTEVCVQFFERRLDIDITEDTKAFVLSCFNRLLNDVVEVTGDGFGQGHITNKLLPYNITKQFGRSIAILMSIETAFNTDVLDGRPENYCQRSGFRRGLLRCLLAVLLLEFVDELPICAYQSSSIRCISSMILLGFVGR